MIYGWAFVGGIRGDAVVADGALDTVDTHDRLAQPIAGCEAGFYHVNGQDGWDGDTGFYGADVRSPLMPGETKTWLLYYWELPGYAPTDGGLTWGLVNGTPLPSNVSASLECVQVPQGISGGPTVGTVWTTPPSIDLPVLHHVRWSYRLWFQVHPDYGSRTVLRACASLWHGWAGRHDSSTPLGLLHRNNEVDIVKGLIKNW